VKDRFGGTQIVVRQLRMMKHMVPRGRPIGFTYVRYTLAHPCRGEGASRVGGGVCLALMVLGSGLVRLRQGIGFGSLTGCDC
jgi:hypothetical protein